MATTSLWHVEGRLKDLIDYVENPEKTASKTPELQDLYNVFSYVQRPEATQAGEYVTAINCLKETALRQMMPFKIHLFSTTQLISSLKMSSIFVHGF